MDDWDKRNRDTSVTFFMNGMRVLWELVGLGGQKKNITIVFIWLVVLQILALLFPYLLKLVFDEMPSVEEGRVISSYLMWILTIIFVVKGLSIYLKRFVKEKRWLKSLIILENFWPAMAQEKLLALSLGYHEKENTGKKIAKIEKGCNRLLEISMNLFWNFFPQLLYVSINVIFVFIIDWKLGIIFLFPFIPAVWLNLRSYDLFVHKYNEWDAKREFSSGLFCQSLMNVQTVVSFAQEEREKKDFLRVRDEMRDLDIDIQLKIQKYLFGMEFLLNFFFVLTIIAGIYFVYIGESTLGTVVYIIATGNVTNESVWQLTNTYTQIMKHMVSVIRMKELLDEKVDIKNSDSTIVPKKFNGLLELKNVTFVYPRKDKAVLESLSLNIPPDKMTAFVSKTGEGKTTIIRLLCRMYDVSAGSILLDGVDIKNLDLFWYRRLFAIVQQDVDIFDSSLLNNVRYPHPSASEDQVLEAMKAAHLKVVVTNKDRFPDGIHTQVGERGVRLSGGERQRVGIARAYLALLNGAKVLILDEATSSLDSEAEQAIQEMIDKLRKKLSISVIAIAHRLSTIRKADTIYVIGDGNILEKGDHDGLMSKNGLYSKLVELQKFGAIRK